MEMQTTTEYALKILVFLACENKAVPSSVLSQELIIPASDTRYIGRTLKVNGILRTLPGTHGGLVLSKPPEAISVYDIVSVFEGEIKFNRWSATRPIAAMNPSAVTQMNALFAELEQFWKDRLQDVTLATLLDSKIAG